MKHTIQKQTEKYIREHPSVKDCLKNGLVNYSALTREISKELKINNFDAILVACRRYKEKITQEKTLQKEIKKILKNSKLEIKNKMIIAIVDKPRYFNQLFELEKKIKSRKGIFNLIEGTNTVTIITNSEFKELIEGKLKNNITRINQNLVQINIICPPEIETTPGVISYIYSFFAENGINILEEMSCWTDVMIIIEEKDLARTMEFLKF
ncbi:ACT domain-containing protein [Candidatus Woesearchaeota archaeon]|nr:ACT domain-containing protein [Candidatus Woesearchaeota archaeon]